jgi:hypothetical protein
MEGDPLGGRDREEELIRWLVARVGGAVVVVAWRGWRRRCGRCCALRLSLAGWLAAGPATKGNAARSSKQVRQRGERADSRQQRLRAQPAVDRTHGDKAALMSEAGSPGCRVVCVGQCCYHCCCC